MNYENFARLQETAPAPDSSWVVVADVKGSTEAVKEGRYREVNLVGAACVAAIRNHFSSRQMPYVFGGDGATFLVRDEDLSLCLELLGQVQLIARDAFALQLGLGQLQVKSIRELGSDIRIGFLPLGPSEEQPFFRGPGMALAEKKIKESMNVLAPSAGVRSDRPVIEGLSCRLMPFQAERGRVLSILVEPTVAATMEDHIFGSIFAIFKRRGAIERLRPLARIRRPWLQIQWLKEARLHRRGPSWVDLFRALIQAALASVLTTAIFRFKWKTAAVGDIDTYNRHMLQQSDWMKMDGVLRMVIDATAEEEAELRLVLEGLESTGQINYGIFASGAALMTCHFQSGVGQKHVHFIDGADGGLTLAAKEMKAKKKMRDAALSSQQSRSA